MGLLYDVLHLVNALAVENSKDLLLLMSFVASL
jgi:hypothetical protein